MLNNRNNNRNNNNQNIKQKELSDIINMFHEKDFKGKKVIFIMAKTWGAARMFYFKTILCKFKNIRIEYLNNVSQLFGLDTKDAIVIKLDRALESERNIKIEEFIKQKEIKVLKFKIPEGV